MGLGFTFDKFSDDFGIFDGYFDPIRRAATGAMKDLSETAKMQGRAEISRAGFSKRWQNTLRSEAYPKRDFSANAAVWLYHRIPYAGVFEEGARIRGKPLMWVPLSSTPKIGRNKPLTPKSFAAAYGKLVPMRGKQPLLGAPVKVTRAAARRGGPYRVTRAALRNGASGQGIIRTVPVFVGVDTVNIRKRFNLAKTFDQASRQLPQLYLNNLKV